jgi:hypothetical protein
MATKASKQYTIRNVPDYVDEVLRRRAQDSRKSFNQVALEALIAGTGMAARPKRDFSEIAGTLSPEEGHFLEEEIRRQRQIDPQLWQ